ncbi:hypothetical protein M3J09_008096 [Ascochyta lentis]
MEASSRSWSRQSFKLLKRQICTQVLRPPLEIAIDRRIVGAENLIKGDLSRSRVRRAHLTVVPCNYRQLSQGRLSPWQRLKTCHHHPQLIYLEHLQGPPILSAQLNGTLCGLTGLRHRDCGVKRGITASYNEASLY